MTNRHRNETQGSRFAALVLVLLIHLFFYKVLTSLTVGDSPSQDVELRTELFFVRPHVVEVKRPSTRFPVESDDFKKKQTVPKMRTSTPSTSSPIPTTELTDKPLKQIESSLQPDQMIRKWSENSRQEMDFKQDPLRSRIARLPGGNSRLSMRTADNSPQRLLRRIGSIVGGRDYDPDPCPRNRQNIAALSTSMDEGERAALMRDLEFDREHCRP